jgi:hypothetical protein
MNLEINLTGTSPLLMSNPRMADPQFPLKREVDAISAKRKKTDADYQRMEVLDWFGGLYEENGVIVQPTSKVRKSMIEAGRISKQGKSVERAIFPVAPTVPLQYDGPSDPKEVYASGNGFVSRLSVVVSARRIMKIRPQFFPWALSVEVAYIEDAGLNLDDVGRLVKLAGVAIGIGDGRAIGYGRFTAEVVEL